VIGFFIKRNQELSPGRILDGAFGGDREEHHRTAERHQPGISPVPFVYASEDFSCVGSSEQRKSYERASEGFT